MSLSHQINKLNENKSVPSYTIDQSELTDLGGSTGAYLWEDKETQSKWVLKFGNNLEQLYNEFVSNKIYDKFDIKVPPSRIIMVNGQLAIAMDYLEGSVAFMDALDQGLIDVSQVFRGFLIDVLTANWDVLGTNYNLDNIRFYEGELYRVDLGGTFDSRAQGGTKLYDGSSISEIRTLVEFNRYVFAQMDEGRMKEDFKELFDDYLNDNTIDQKQLKIDIFEVIMENTKDISDLESFSKAERLADIMSEKVSLIHNYLS